LLFDGVSEITYFLWRIRYQMKSHAFLVGVNVAASLPLVFAPQAMAEGNNLSATANFLKAAVAEKATARSMSDPHAVPSFQCSKRSLPIKRDLSSSSFSEPRAVQTRLAMTPIAGSVKLRPFVPGRKLPSRSDLQSQMPQLDNSNQPNLSASINESSFAAQPVQNDSNYSAPGYSSYRAQQVNTAQNRSRLRQAAECVASFQRKNAARTLPGQSPSTPGQVGFPCAQQAVAHMSPAAKPAPSEVEWTQMARNAANGSTTESEAEQMASLQAEFAASQAPAHVTAGPAPFPLSLIPEASLKQLIGSTAKAAPPAAGGSSMRAQKAMTPSYFGSWHGSQQAAAQGHGHVHSNLQPSGFHTYLAGGNSARGGRVVSASAFKSYAPMAYKATRRSAPHIAAVVKKSAAAAAPMIATYGTYHSAAGPAI